MSAPLANWNQKVNLNLYLLVKYRSYFRPIERERVSAVQQQMGSFQRAPELPTTIREEFFGKNYQVDVFNHPQQPRGLRVYIRNERGLPIMEGNIPGEQRQEFIQDIRLLQRSQQSVLSLLTTPEQLQAQEMELELG